ncbi:DUF5677 domain-containing protein [Halosimplex amylolyticum]|uniref:DUF5677 domain-containing protein n=1 Tax=Halosimplex amylolyticum TaxID=3396616 RepID=UPI003F57785A
MGDNNGVLSDHQRDRTKFVPPFLDTLGDQLEPVNWQYEVVPEIIWIGLLFENNDPRRAVEITKTCAQEAQELFNGSDYVYSCDFDGLTDSDFRELRENLDDDIASDLDNALGPFVDLYPSFPQAGLINNQENHTDEYLENLQILVDELSNRRSRKATLAQATYLFSLMATGNLKIPPGTALEDINDLMHYPETEQSKKVAATVRAATKSTRGFREDGQSDWAKRFWKRGFEITDCIFPQQFEGKESEDTIEQNPLDEITDNLISLGIEYDENLRRILLDTWWKADPDPEFSGKDSVLDALLMRQVNFSTKLATTPNAWSMDIGGTILRCMSDTYITLEWFNKQGEKEDYQDFIEYGLGQQKLFLEHASDFLTNYQGDAGQIEEKMDKLERALEEQRYTFLLPVDVGSWNTDTRTMAQEADCEDVYNLRFSLHSATVHGVWYALEQQNLTKCYNPLHNYHRIPEFRGPARNPFAVVEAGNLMNRSIDSWLEARDISSTEGEILDLAANAKGIISDYIEIPV